MISVIVPVYNVEKYLDECVQSIIRQTYSDFELILVDDGSTDNSGILCDEYAERDSRVNVVHKTNGGLSDARNVGTATAKGDYITYIDSDDYIADDYLHNLRTLIVSTNADIAATGMKRFYDGDRPAYNNTDTIYNYSGLEALRNVLYQNKMDTSACALMIKSDIAKKYPFPYGRFHEDDFTTYKYYLDSQKVALSTKEQYFYRQRKSSITSEFGKPSMDELDAADNLVSVCADLGYGLKEAAQCKQFSDYCQVFLSNSNLKNTHPDVYERIKVCLLNNRYMIMRNRFARKKNRIAAMSLIFGLYGLKTLGKIRDAVM